MEERVQTEVKLTRNEQVHVSPVSIGSNTPTARIKLNAPQFKRECESLIDTGSEINLVRSSCVKPSVEVNKKEQIFIHGFGDAFELSSGTVSIDVCKVPTKFHLVPNGIPKNIDGMLGAPFFREGAVIDFKREQIAKDDEKIPFISSHEHLIEARKNACIAVKCYGADIGYIRRRNISKDVYLGDCVVTNRNGMAILRCVSASAEVANFSLPALEVEEIEEAHTAFRSDSNLSHVLKSH